VTACVSSSRAFELIRTEVRGYARIGAPSPARLLNLRAALLLVSICAEVVIVVGRRRYRAHTLAV